jgi:hypothetical protein
VQAKQGGIEMNRILIMAACVTGVLAFTGSAATAGAAGEKRPEATAGKKPAGIACLQTGRQRERDCPVWVEYDLVVTYSGTEETTLHDPNKLLSYESVRKIRWQAKSSKPVRVNRPQFRGTPFQLSAVVNGSYNSTELRSEYRWCQQKEVAIERVARAFKGEVFAGVGLRVAAMPLDNAISASGRAVGGKGVIYGGNVTGPLRFSPPASWICTKVPTPGKDDARPNATTNELSFLLQEPKEDIRVGSSAEEFGNQVISGRMFGKDHSESTTLGNVGTKDARWVWDWTLICRRTAKGSC